MSGEWHLRHTESATYEYYSVASDVYVEKTNSQIEMHSNGNSFVYGPFSYASDGKNVTYSCEVYDHSGNVISGVSVSGGLGTRK